MRIIKTNLSIYFNRTAIRYWFICTQGSYKPDIKKVSFHATKLKQENCDLEVVQIPQYQNLCSTVHVYIYSNKIEVLDYFLNYYYFDRESPWIQDSQREKN